MAVFSEVRKNHVSALCGQNVEFLNVKTVSTAIVTNGDLKG
jgi:hypothetical protein